jgi:membrane-associated phospholipid phosphatase
MPFYDCSPGAKPLLNVTYAPATPLLAGVGGLGYLFGRNLPRLEHYIGQATLAFVLLVTLVVALFLGARWFRRNASRISVQISQNARRIASSHILQQLRASHPQAWEFLARRFEPGEYLGLHLSIGLIISIAALCLFGGVTEDVLHHDPLTQFDVMLLEWFHAHSTMEGVDIFAAISSLGSPPVLTGLGAVVAVIFAVKRSWILFAGWLAALGGVGVLDELLKHIIRRPRPPYALAILHGYSFSFPSGHAMASLIAYGMIAYLLAVFWAKRWWLRVGIVATAAILILSIGVSRLYLGVHYFSDVVGGYAAGVIWLSACITGTEVARRQPAIQA